VRFVGPEVYCLPEVIHGSLPSWASTPYEFVYEMRKMLEDPSMTPFIHNWIEKLWVTSTAFARISHHAFLKACPNRMDYIPERREHIDYFIDLSFLTYAWLSDGEIGVVSVCGKIMILKIVGDNIHVKHEYQLSGESSNHDFFIVDKKLMVYDRFEKALIGIVDQKTIEVDIYARLFVPFGEEFIHCPNPFGVWRSHQLLCTTENRITSLAASWVFQMFVFATSDCKVHFHCARKGRQTQLPIQLEELILGILVTEKLGFVVMYSTHFIYLYNINASAIKQVRIPSQVVTWSTFSTYSGFDYIVCLIGINQVFVFEAFYPDKMKLVSTVDDVIFAQFDPRFQKILILNFTGNLSLISISNDVST
jgi:hypothetical protein